MMGSVLSTKGSLLSRCQDGWVVERSRGEEREEHYCFEDVLELQSRKQRLVKTGMDLVLQKDQYLAPELGV